MAMSDKELIIDVLMKEYDKLKSEQTQRIGFRDNLLYVTLGLQVSIVSFAVSNPSNYSALLVIPWVCLILGWTYVVNDEKISAIGQYIRDRLISKIKTQIGSTDPLLEWEIDHRNDRHRQRRKFQQLIIDEITFVISGAISLSAFWLLVPHPSIQTIFLASIELIFLVVLGIEIFIYSDRS
jgi:hypothetical protein